MSKVDKIFKQLPNELKNKILKEMTLTPSHILNFSKRLSPKTKNKVLTCNQILKLKNLNENQKLKELKLAKIKCTQDDLITASKKNYQNIFDYITKMLGYNLENLFNILIDYNETHTKIDEVLFLSKSVEIWSHKHLDMPPFEILQDTTIITLFHPERTINGIKFAIKHRPFPQKIQFSRLN